MDKTKCQKLVECQDCGYRWESSASKPRCSKAECGRSRNVEPVYDEDETNGTDDEPEPAQDDESDESDEPVPEPIEDDDRSRSEPDQDDDRDDEDNAPEDLTLEDSTEAKQYDCGGCSEPVDYLQKRCSNCGEQLMWSAIGEQ